MGDPAGRQRSLRGGHGGCHRGLSRPHDPDRPVVCVDETSKPLIVETRTPIPAKPGQPRRVDYEYKRNGTANLFMMAFRRGLSRTARNADMMFAPP
jgi:hypothetical protein